MLKMKRIYDEEASDDGYRILVDRLWPRGVSKERADLDYWAKEISPTDETRKTYNHHVEQLGEFTKAYLDELNHNEKSAEFINLIREKLKLGNVTLLYASRNEDINHTAILIDWLKGKL